MSRSASCSGFAGNLVQCAGSLGYAGFRLWCGNAEKWPGMGAGPEGCSQARAQGCRGPGGGWWRRILPLLRRRTLAVALSHFGTWSHLGTTRSSATDIFPGTATLSFRTASYRSSDLTLRTTERPADSDRVIHG
jgi:hypothetical protein